MTYDFDSRLISAAGPSGTTTYLYDGYGNRLKKSTNGVATDYLVDTTAPYAQVIQERTGAAVTNYDFGDELVRLDRGTGEYYYIYDGLGSTRALTDASGASVGAYDYDAYGNPSPAVGSIGTDFLFNGQQYDFETGLYFLRARYYAPGQGRFLSQDPYEGDVSNPSTLHRYRYAANDPVNFSDPGGMSDTGTLDSTMVSTFMAASLSAVLMNSAYQLRDNISFEANISTSNPYAQNYRTSRGNRPDPFQYPPFIDFIPNPTEDYENEDIPRALNLGAGKGDYWNLGPEIKDIGLGPYGVLEEETKHADIKCYAYLLHSGNFPLFDAEQFSSYVLAREEYPFGFEFVVINNNKGWDPNLDGISHVLRPGGRIVIQGRWKNNGWFTRAVKAIQRDSRFEPAPETDSTYGLDPIGPIPKRGLRTGLNNTQQTFPDRRYVFVKP